jgi:hypothetical protein
MDRSELPERERHARGAQEYIEREFPRLHERLPTDLPLFSSGFGAGDGVCTHPELMSRDWLAYWGGPAFRAASVPDGFVAAGIKNSGGSEYVFAMWRHGGRVLWFQDQYVNFHGGAASQDRTRARLDAALARWDSSSGDVVVSGDQDTGEL